MSKIINGEYAPDNLTNEEICNRLDTYVYNSIKKYIDSFAEQDGTISCREIMTLILEEHFKLGSSVANEIMEQFQIVYSLY